MFRLGFSTLSCPSYTVDEVIELAVASGLEGVELRFIESTIDLASLPDFAPESWVATRAKFEAAGLTIVCVDSGARLGEGDETNRDAQLAAARQSAAIASGIGARYVRIFGGKIDDDADWETAIAAIVGDLSLFADECAEQGVTALIEMHDVFSTSDRIVDLYERGASRNLGVLWDSLHSFRHGESAAYTWSRIARWVRHVHMKDADSASADTFSLVLTGTGIVPLDEIVDVLTEGGYDGFVNFEWEKGWMPQLEAPEIAVPHFAHALAALTARP